MLKEKCTTCAVIQYCSAQDTLHVPPEHRRFRRVHGLQPPLHPQQIVGWVLLVVIFAGTFTVLLTTSLLPDLRSVLSLLFATLLLLHLLAHLTALLLDPADPEVRTRPTNEIVPEFDRTKHRHVIENGRCHLCNITARDQHTKHCSVCNKCVPRFDHHCKWLNNCIGGRNYPAFLACLVSTLVAALSVTAFALSELVLVNVVNNECWTNNSSNNSTNMNNATTPSLPSLPMPGAGSLILVIIIGVLSTVAAVLLIHLCFFHGYIAYLGLTTYEYVRRKRERDTTGTPISARVVSSDGPCGASYCTGGNDEQQTERMVRTRSLYSRLCENHPFRAGAGQLATATTDVFVWSTRNEARCDDVTNSKNRQDAKTLSSPRRGSRNFHLCFSYDVRTTETSIEVSSSRTTDVLESKSHKDSPDTKSCSTPSPVSCCFSIMNHPESTKHDRNGRRRRTNEHRPETAAKRSCGAMRRIQTFLQVRLRRSSRQRSATPLTTAAGGGRHCGNKIIPQVDSPPDVVPVTTAENQDQIVSMLTTELRTPPHDPRLPARLPALDMPRVVHSIEQVPPGPTDMSVLGPMISKRKQAHFCTRQSASLSRKRPRFKIGSHIVTQTAQLSPILESEFSKPATPKSPLRSDPAFAFPSLRD